MNKGHTSHLLFIPVAHLYWPVNFPCVRISLSASSFPSPKPIISRKLILCKIVLQKTVAAGAVDRLTDTSKYTGSHKERFDESGKGKGIAGRAELTDQSGYVGAYKGSGTYDKTH